MSDSDEEKLFGGSGTDSSDSDSDSSASPTKDKPSTTPPTKPKDTPGDKTEPSATATSETKAPELDEAKRKEKADDERLFGGSDSDSSSESGQDISKVKKKKTTAEDEENRRLFGDASSDSDDASGEKKIVHSEEEEEVIVAPDPIELQLPKVPKPPVGADIRYARLPNLIHLSPYAFDEDTYSENSEMKELKKLGKELVGDNIVRWRYKRDVIKQKVMDDKTGKPVIESNARFVEWSDGSVQLLIGNEVVDVVSQPVKGSFLYSMAVDKKSDRTCLEAHGRFSQDLKFRPTSLASGAHKDLEMQVKGKNLKTVKLLPTSTIVDPEKEQDDRARAREEVLRLKERQRAKNEYEYGRRGRNKQWNQKFLEEGADSREYDEEEEYGTSVKAIKEKYGKGAKTRRAFSSSDDDSSESSDDEYNAAAKRRKVQLERQQSADTSAKSSEEPKEASKEESPAKVVAPAAEEEKVQVVSVSKKRRAHVIDSDSD